MRHKAVIIGALLTAANSAHAWEFRSRFVERVGNVDVVLPHDIDGFSRRQHRVRIQFGVFDDADGAAPAGGFVGWNVGIINVSGLANNSDESRTPGRLAPFVFAHWQGANGNPIHDPFERITDIDATLGPQPFAWTCGPDGHPLPMPEATVRGLNTFVSVYEITVDTQRTLASYQITFSGNLIAASEWRTIGTPFPPDCENPDEPGYVEYVPWVLTPQPFTRTLDVIMPAPGVAALLTGMLVMCVGRRR